MALEVAKRLHNQGIGVTVIDPRWVLPVSDGVLELAAQHKLLVTLEDNGVNGGVGSAVSAALRRAEIDVPCRDVGLPQEFYEHASRGEVLADLGLTDQDVARRITGWVAALGSSRHRSGDPRAPRLAVGARPASAGGCSAAGQNGIHEFSLPRPARGRRTGTLRRPRQGRLRPPSPSTAAAPGRARPGSPSEPSPAPTPPTAPARAASSRAAASGLRLLHRAGGGGPFGGSASSGGFLALPGRFQGRPTTLRRCDAGCARRTPATRSGRRPSSDRRWRRR